MVIPFETPDFLRNPAAGTSYISQIFFASGQLSGVSVAQYFLENSYGDYQVTNGGVSDWVSLDKNLTDYIGFEGDDDLPRDVLELANINWPALDVNNDHVITPAEAQIVFLVANGYSAATRGFADYPADWVISDPRPPEMSSLQANTPSGVFNFKPRVVYMGLKKANDPNFDTNPIRDLHSLCHELCHAFFNLTDRYLNGACGTGGPGPYSIMSDNCSWEHMLIHDKMKIGWIQPKIVAGHLDKCLAFPASESSPTALVLLAPQDPHQTDEYWIVENRHKPSSDCGSCVLNLPQFLGYNPGKVGVFDRDLPESGLAVWWVKTGAYFSGYDDIRLVNASLPDQDPNGTTAITGADPGYVNPIVGALFKRDDADPQKLLLNSNGEWSLLFFRGVSDPGATMYAEF